MRSTARSDVADGSLRVAIVFGTYPPDRNGGADFIQHFARALSARGIETHVLTGAHHDSGPRVADGDVTVHRIVDDWSFSGRCSLSRANRVVEELDVDIVHAFFPDAAVDRLYRLPGLVGAGRVPLVTTWWNLALGRRSAFGLKAASALLLARSRVLSTHDPGYLRALRLFAVGRPAELLPVGNNLGPPAGASPAEVRARHDVGDAALLGFFGHLDFTRGIEDLFAAVAQLRRTRDVCLLMIGAGSEYEAYRRQERAHGIEGAVRWTGYLEPGDAADALCALDLCVLPYRRNSVGRSAVAAALSLGVPTVLGGSPRDVQPLVVGRHVAVAPRADAAALADVVGRLLDDDAARAALAQGAHEAAAFFGWDAIAARAEALYGRALGRVR